MILGAAFAALAAISCIVARALSAARWPYRAPRAAIALWQAIGLACGLALIGAALSAGLAPYEQGVAFGLLELARRGSGPLGAANHAALTVGLIVSGILLSALVTSFVEAVAARRRHRSLLALVARADPGIPGALVLDHPEAAAYCLPGVRARIVVSAGAVRMLRSAELAAVLAHERAHVREHHHLVLLPFASLRRALPRFGVLSDAIAAVHLLVEMRADDRARGQHASRPLARALARFGTAPGGPAPCGALAAADHQVLLRVRRLVEPSPELPMPARMGVYAAAFGWAALPVVLLWLPVA